MEPSSSGYQHSYCQLLYCEHDRRSSDSMIVSAENSFIVEIACWLYSPPVVEYLWGHTIFGSLEALGAPFFSEDLA
jgi:hypothetical protein